MTVDDSLTRAEVAGLRAQFPAFGRRVNTVPLVYLDNASTTQKPATVIRAVTHAYEQAANIHRGVHTLSVENTEAYEAVRAKAAALLGAADPKEIVFVRGTTEALNLVAQTYGKVHVCEGDEILISQLEHHSNIVPWQMLCQDKGAKLRVLPIDARGDVILERLDELLGPRTRVVAIAHVSNSLGTVLPVAEIARRAKMVGAITLVDGAQAVAHRPVDVRSLGCDFYAFSGHKLYGPTGAGVLWGRRELLESMPPWQGGGDMILSVTFEQTTYQEIPHRFEAGTPDIVSVIGLGAAIDWLLELGLSRVAAREAQLLSLLTRWLSDMEGVRFFGTARERASVLSFNLGELHAHDVGTALDLEGVAVRTGHHCAQPVMEHFGVDAMVRASLGVYTTEEDLCRLVTALHKARQLLGAR